MNRSQNSTRNLEEVEPYKNVTLYDAGGGPGSHGLTFQNLSKGQYDLFRTTIDGIPPTKKNDLAQEKRQIQPTEFIVKLTIRVTREDFPDISGEIIVEYYPSSAQQAWEKFMSDICKMLKIEFIYMIIEKATKLPIFRIAKLKQLHEYLIRLREDSAVLEVLNTGIAPLENSWLSTKDIVQVKQDLAHNLKHVEKVNTRIVDLITKPMTTHLEKNVAEQIMALDQPGQIVQLVNYLYLSSSVDELITKRSVALEELMMVHPLATLSIEYSRTKSFYHKVDIIAIHRLALERLNRLAAMGDSKGVVKESFQYILKLLKEFLSQVDIVVIAMKVLTDLMPHLYLFKEKVFPAVLDVLQFHAAPSPAHRPRHPKRLDKIVSEESILNAGSEMKYSLELNELELARSIASLSTSNVPKTSDGYGDTFEAITIPEDWNVNNQLTRYGDEHVMEADRLSHRKMTNTIQQFAKLIEFDEYLQPITPRTKKQKLFAQQQEVERQRLLEEEMIKRKLEEEVARLAAEAQAIAEAEAAAEEERLKPRTLVTGRQQRSHYSPKGVLNRKVIGNTEVVRVRTWSNDGVILDDHGGSADDYENLPNSGRGRITRSRSGSQSSPKAGNSPPSTSPKLTSYKVNRSRVASPNINVPKAALNHVRAQAVANAAATPTTYVDKKEDDDLPKTLNQSIATLFPTINSKSNPLIIIDPKTVEAAADATEGIRPSDLQEQLQQQQKDQPKFKIVIKRKPKHNKQKGQIDENQDKEQQENEPMIRWKGNKGEIGKLRPAGVAAGKVATKKANPHNQPAFFTVSKRKSTVEELKKLQEEFENGGDDDDVDREELSDKANNNSQTVTVSTLPLISSSTAEGGGTERAGVVGGSSRSGTSPKETNRKSLVMSSPPEKEVAVVTGENNSKSNRVSFTANATATNNDNSATKDINPVSQHRESFQTTATIPSSVISSSTPGENSINNNTTTSNNLLTAQVISFKPKKTRLKLEPLPTVNCPTFRGYEHQSKENIVLTQGFAIVLKMMILNFGYREYCFHNLIVEELSEIVLVCSSIPKILEYFMDIIQTMYSEGFGDPFDDSNIYQLMNTDDPSMIVSNASLTIHPATSTAAGSLMMTGKILEEVSEISVPTINDHGQISMISVSDNKYNQSKQPPPAIPTDKVTVTPSVHSSNTMPTMCTILQPAALPHQPSPRSIGAVADKLISGHPENERNLAYLEARSKQLAGAGSTIAAGVSVVLSVNETRYALAKQKQRHNQEMLNQIGQVAFDARYVNTPADSIIMAIAMCTYHVEVNERERDLGKYWLEVWNDNSFEYKALIRKGKNLCGL